MRLWERICETLERICGDSQAYMRLCKRICEDLQDFGRGFVGICKTLGEDL